MRVALGATGATIVRLALRNGLGLTAVGLLLIVAALASYLPARQASRIDAIATLRE